MALGTNNASQLTQEQVRTMLVQPLEQQSTFLQAGPVIFDNDGNQLRIPLAPTSGADDLTFTGENTKITEQDATFSELTLLPSTMQSVKTLTRFSNELARQSIVNLEAALRQRLVADVATKIDQQLLSDKGDGVTTPLGLFAYAGTQNVTAETDFTPDTLLDAYGKALVTHIDSERLSLFLRPEDYMTLRKLKDENGRYLVEPDVSTGRVIVPLLGATAYISQHIPAGKAALVDMSQVAVVRDVAPSVTLLSELYGDYDQQALRVVTRLDAGAINPDAIVTITMPA